MAEVIGKHAATSLTKATPAPVFARFVAAPEASGTAGREALLEVQFSQDASDPGSSRGPVVPLPGIQPTSVVERWEIDGAVQDLEEQGFMLASGGSWCAGWAEAPGDDIERASRELYARLLELVSSRGLHLHRIWNAVPHINARREGVDRYQLFSRGRAEAFDRVWGPGFESRLCAFTAVGSEAPALVLWFLASQVPGQPAENPRQVPAWRYPQRYGPRSPSFARALRLPPQLGGSLLLSGTASIVGHESLHAGDVVAQTHETLRNLHVLLGGEQESRGSIQEGRMSAVKVYLRDSRDRERIEPILRAALGDGTEVLWLRADVCRSELLIEIEGLGSALLPAGDAVHTR
jgi:chorismate lyase/3-hydroxybenzoate synthase